MFEDFRKHSNIANNVWFKRNYKRVENQKWKLKLQIFKATLNQVEHSKFQYLVVHDQCPFAWCWTCRIRYLILSSRTLHHKPWHLKFETSVRIYFWPWGPWDPIGATGASKEHLGAQRGRLKSKENLRKIKVLFKKPYKTIWKCKKTKVKTNKSQ